MRPEAIKITRGRSLEMPRYYYGTVPALAWIINHYFYARVHYAWLAESFFMLAPNPKSSIPYLIYMDLYYPWARHDRYDRYVREYRRSLRNGIRAQRAAGTLDKTTAARLRRVCEAVSVDLFYPVVYRVDVTKIAPARRSVAGSGLNGSHELLIKDLRETEFDLLFADNHDDDLFRGAVIEELAGKGAMEAPLVLELLEDRRL